MQEEKLLIEIFQKRLLEMVLSKNMTQKDLSLSTKIAQSAISKYLTGKALPRTLELSKLSRALGVSMDWLCGIDNDPPPSDNLMKENMRLRTAFAVAVGTLEEALSALRKGIQ